MISPVLSWLPSSTTITSQSENKGVTHCMACSTTCRILPSSLKAGKITEILRCATSPICVPLDRELRFPCRAYAGLHPGGQRADAARGEPGQPLRSEAEHPEEPKAQGPHLHLVLLSRCTRATKTSSRRGVRSATSRVTMPAFTSAHTWPRLHVRGLGGD